MQKATIPWSVGVLEYWSIGVLEYWSIGVLDKDQYSNTPWSKLAFLLFTILVILVIFKF